MDIEKVANETPEKIITKKIDYSVEGPSDNEIKEIISIFNLKGEQINKGKNLIKILYKILVDKDASLIEINPLIITEEKNLICLDAKMNFDDNAILEPDI